MSAKRALIEATMAKLQSMSRAEVESTLGPAEVVEVDPTTDCLTQRLLDDDAAPIPEATPARMEELRRRLVGMTPQHIEEIQARLDSGQL
ncbi:MAG: hypothetical protein ACR2H3_13965 [Acidimicrobiales bacterium]